MDWGVPIEWKICKLKNIASIQTGNTPPKNVQSTFYSDESGTPWIKAEDLGERDSISKTKEYLTEDGKKEGRIFPANTVFVCCIASIGKTGFSVQECSCNQQINGIIFNKMQWKYGYYMTLAQESEYIFNVVYDMKNTLDDFRVYQKSEVDKFADIFYQNENQSAGDLGKLQGQLRPAVDRYEVLEVEKQDIFKSTLASFNRVYAYITQVCRLFDKDIHRFSIYSKFLYTMLPKGHGGEKINIDDKVLLEYYKLEKDFEGPIELESTEGGYTPISGDSGHREPKKDPLTVIIDKINEKYGTRFTEMDKVLVQMENDYANQEKWQSYAKNNDRATFMLLFEKDFPNMAADRYEQNDQFFRKLFDDPDMMRQVMETVGSVLYERLKKKYIFDPKSGVIEEATPETYVEDTYLMKK